MTYRLFLADEFSPYSVDLEFQFDIVRTIDSGRKRSLTTISNQSPQAARHFAFQPGEQNPTIQFRLYNNGEDKSNGTLSSSSISDSRFNNGTVTTLQEQIVWLDEYMADNTSDSRWVLFGGRWDQNDGNGTNVVVRDVTLNQAAGVTTVDGTLDLKLGVTI